MKVFQKDGNFTEHEPVDAREIVASDPDKYSLTDPTGNYAPGESAGQVLLRSSQLRHEENMRSQFDQQANATAVRDQAQVDAMDPAKKARREADEANRDAIAAEQMAEAATMPSQARAMNAPLLKKRAEEARRRAEDLDKKATATEKTQAANTKKYQEMREKERKDADAQANKGKTKRKGADKPDEAETHEELMKLSKDELHKKLKKAKVDFGANDTKEELVDKYLATQQDDTRTENSNPQG